MWSLGAAMDNLRFCDRDYGEDGPDGEFYGVSICGARYVPAMQRGRG